jgi:hypothetical protein
MSRKGVFINEDEPLVDTTASLTLHSKRTERLLRKQTKKSQRKVRSEINSFLDLPGELLIEVLSHLRPSDIYAIHLVNNFAHNFISINETAIATSIKDCRYWVLQQCFPLPLPLDSVADFARKALLSQPWQDRLKIHRNPYQHIHPIPSHEVCTCMSCVLGWNNLNIILDLSHWQTHLSTRQPLPIIPRGRTPEWNTNLLAKHAEIVRLAMTSPLAHARILQIHLSTTTNTIKRMSQWRKKSDKLLLHQGIVVQKPRLYHLTDAEADEETDEYLERSGPPSYQPIYMRDNYYSVEAFVPNRKWDKEEGRWRYYGRWPQAHINDLSWVVGRFSEHS